MRIQRNRSGGAKRGAVLAVTLFVSATVAVLATCLLQLAGATQKRQLAAVELRRAFYMADAGVAEAYAGLVVGKTGNVGSPTAPAKLGNFQFDGMTVN